ncbi:MAG: HIT domain-containing protein [Planctomycetota bacterium]
MQEEPTPPQNLQAPWRMAYIRSLEKAPELTDPLLAACGGCFLCAAARYDEADEPEEEAIRNRLVLWRSDFCVCLINRYPYTNGHLMIAPRRHEAFLENLDADEAADLHTQTVRAIELLKAVMHPQGFNVGINLGSAAGAGVPGHLHRHIVPRWGGDANFMSVVGNVRVVPEAVEETWRILREALVG